MSPGAAASFACSWFRRSRACRGEFAAAAAEVGTALKLPEKPPAHSGRSGRGPPRPIPRPAPSQPRPRPAKLRLEGNPRARGREAGFIATIMERSPRQGKVPKSSAGAGTARPQKNLISSRREPGPAMSSKIPRHEPSGSSRKIWVAPSGPLFRDRGKGSPSRLVRRRRRRDLPLPRQSVPARAVVPPGLSTGPRSGGVLAWSRGGTSPRKVKSRPLNQRQPQKFSVKMGASANVRDKEGDVVKFDDLH